MLSLLKRKPKPSLKEEPVVETEPAVLDLESAPSEPMRRMRQQNIKATDDVCLAFEAIANALAITKADLFEDMVAERLEGLRRQGVEVEARAGAD